MANKLVNFIQKVDHGPLNNNDYKKIYLILIQIIKKQNKNKGSNHLKIRKQK